MQATDLLLGFFTDKRLTQDPFPQKADGSLYIRDSFQAMFDKAISRPAPKADFNNLANNRNDSQQKSNDALNVSASDARKAQTADRSDSNVSTQKSATERIERQQTDSVKAETQQNAQQAKQAEAGQDTQNATKKMDALIDRIQEEIDKGKDQTDSQMVELLLQLIAMLLAAAQGTQVGETAKSGDASVQDLLNAQSIDGASGSSALNVGLTLDPNSKLFKVLDMLLNGKDGLTAKDLEDVNILLKLTGDKGLLIPLSELVKNGGDSQEGEAKITLQLSDQTDASKTVELKLTVNADDVKAAKLVSLSDPALKQSDLVMIIPLERLAADAAAKAELQKMLDALANQGLQNEAITALPQEEIAAAGIEDEAQAKIVVPLKTATSGVKSENANVLTAENKTATPKVETVDPMFFSSDKYLKALQVENMAKEMANGGVDRREIFDKLQRLLLAGDQNSTNLNELFADKKDSSFSFLKQWTQNFSEQQSKENASEWTSTLTKEIAPQQTSNATADVSGERIMFAGRTEAGSNLSQIAAERTVDTARTAQGSDLKESVMQQIVQRAAYTFQNGAGGEVRIFLRPENLGDLQMKIKIDADVVTAKFTASSNEVKAIIESNLGQLKNALDQMGIKVGKFEVHVNTGSGQQPQQGTQDGQSDSYAAGQSYSASEAAGTYGATLDLDYDSAALYGSDGSYNAAQGRVNYFA
ncbi:MAG: flagellar hook-length control protein FliK [bacterium]